MDCLKSKRQEGSIPSLRFDFYSRGKEALCQPPNKQLQRTVIRRRGRAASASFHFAHAARWLAQRAAAELRR